MHTTTPSDSSLADWSDLLSLRESLACTCSVFYNTPKQQYACRGELPNVSVFGSASSYALQTSLSFLLIKCVSMVAASVFSSFLPYALWFEQGEKAIVHPIQWFPRLFTHLCSRVLIFCLIVGDVHAAPSTDDSASTGPKCSIFDGMKNSTFMPWLIAFSAWIAR